MLSRAFPIHSQISHHTHHVVLLLFLLLTMKFSAIAVALCVLSPAAAFVVPGPQSAKTSLASSRENAGPEMRTSERSRSAPSRQGRGGDLMSDPNSAYSNVSVQREARNRRDAFAPTIVQGGSLETWSFPDPRIDRVQVRLETEGRPLNANVELWQGPDNSPQVCYWNRFLP